jgi:hypothetical protein
MQGISYNENNMPFINAAKEDLIKSDIALAKEKGAEFIVVYFNWGAEYQGYANVVQQKLGQFAVNEGAHLVIGSRPHIVQKLENKQIVLDNKLHEYIIAYSLGDFYTTSSSLDVNGSIILEVIVSKKKNTNKVEISHFGFISTYTLSFQKNNETNYTIIPVSEIKKGNISASLTKDQRDIMSRSNDKVKYTLANVIDEIQYQLDDKIIADVDEVLTISKRPLNEDKGFVLAPKGFTKLFLEKIDNNLIAEQNEKPKEQKETLVEKNEKIVEQKIEEVEKVSKPILEVKPAIKTLPKVYEEIDITSDKVYYKVQFLALKNKIEINTQYYSHLKGYEVSLEDGYFKYLIGQTTNLKTINDFCLDIKRLGHQTAFVVAYKNGNRIKF